MTISDRRWLGRAHVHRALLNALRFYGKVSAGPATLSIMFEKGWVNERSHLTAAGWAEAERRRIAQALKEDTEE